jgi:hypothetical protein
MPDSSRRSFDSQMHARPRSQLMFRVPMLLFASALAGFSLWVLLPEPARSGIHRLPTDRDMAAAAAPERARAHRAARFGGVRGDLWSEFAYTYSTPLWPGAEPGSDPQMVANEARSIVERALAYAPHDSGVWLLAASLAARFEWPNSDPAAILKTSYYTGLNEIELVPLRLVAATRANALSDTDVQRFVQRDVRMILTRWPELKPTLIAAYGNAAPATKRFLEAAAAETDPGFVQAMRSNATP